MQCAILFRLLTVATSDTMTLMQCTILAMLQEGVALLSTVAAITLQ